MKIVLDSDVLVLALHKPRHEYLIEIGGMDIFVLTYAQIKNAVLVTNDWSLWYVSWKSGVKSYWLSGLSEEQQEKICNGEAVEYP
ncbi:MAG: hypothetical protein ISS94_00890 [Candidatus Syntrophoarchaeum sp.]|nr:hypothetical protein [Candidatus Syntrophoarchaeum sp.]